MCREGYVRALPGLARLRDEAFMTQQELADKSKVGRVNISRIEASGQRVRGMTVRKLARALAEALDCDERNILEEIVLTDQEAAKLEAVAPITETV
jgi:transcriptional regulator with XRE-family HTH domain